MSDSTEIMTAESGTLALLNKGEIDMQIATAHKYPRSITKFRGEVQQMVTLNEQVAQECIYSLPRGGKSIEGPSVRFAEVAASAWGNSRAGARVVNDDGKFITAQGVFHDLERNVAITYEVQRRVTNRSGQRLQDDMIGVTGNAACSIALRNAILKGIPKAFWSDLYDQARETAIGNVQTLANRRARALGVLQKMGVPSPTVFAFLRVEGEADITLEHLATLFGITTAIKEGDTTPEQAFAVIDEPGKPEVKAPVRRTAAQQADPATGEMRPGADVGIPTTEDGPLDADNPAAGADAQPVAAQQQEKQAATATKKPQTIGGTVLASAGEKKLLLNRAKSNDLSMAELIEQAGVGPMDPATLDGLTADGFVAIKDLLPKAA